MRQIFGDLIQVYVERGRKRTFVEAVEWPGWGRMGDDEASALEALFEAAPRYAAVMEASGIEFKVPPDLAGMVVVEWLEGNASTDFGSPSFSPASDQRPVSEKDFIRFQALLMACWQAFDSAVIAASGRQLRKSARGSGQDLASILGHVIASDASDLGRLAWKFKLQNPHNPIDELGRTRQATLNALGRAALGELPEQGKWSSEIWTPRRFVRNIAWHTLDHTWEIEDRLE